ncbi:hypothetical protein A8L34_22425 [Bacillus sp. FJAT-27264]|uniref:hypothetical protein n=1 Tax=Paenibacillus sp. (strain DSM 101736 / FJAT-27264) TaxID=1850362 RepID=UPI000808169E|nr:hypothetical protein [Bacillus sp. FJAT-27264]OBZ08912.1 hypothetical protein A8L34_22425 [Bacillus sp. FJAT-27264]
MNNWHFENRDKAVEQAAGGQGEIKHSQLSPEELEAFRKANPAPTGADAKKPIPIFEYNKRRSQREG